jgi:anti-sigma factor RsiW
MTSTHTLSCREIVELVTDYLEGDLDATTTTALEAHLDVCPGCERYVEQIRETITTLGHISSDNLSTETQSGLLDAFRAFRTPDRSTRPTPKPGESADS